ncbi:MAG TPA: LysE family translocator [Solirubrobacteraceae bacterium]|nr:LysE family translocator [Solirubrobacteraceae bacterium]
MPSAGRLIAFAATAFVVIAIPGPSVLFVVGRALVAGRRVALLSVLGNSIGEYAQVVAVAFGIGALAEQSVAAFTTLRLAGGAYLIFLGVRTFGQRRALAAALNAAPAPRSTRRAFGEAFVVGVTNPKTVVFLAAILPQFTNRGATVATQILVLGLIFMAIALVSDTTWALAAGRFRDWFAGSPRRLELVGGAGGAAIAAVGATFLLTGRRN